MKARTSLVSKITSINPSIMHTPKNVFNNHVEGMIVEDVLINDASRLQESPGAFNKNQTKRKINQIDIHRMPGE